MDKGPEQNFTKGNMTRMVIILCLSLMLESVSAAANPTTGRNMTKLVKKHSSTHVNYHHVINPAQTTHGNMTQQDTEEKLPARKIPLIWIVIATILSSTIIITISVSLGIKIYFKRQSNTKRPETYFNGLFLTNAVFIPIPANYVATDLEVEKSLVFLKIV